MGAVILTDEGIVLVAVFLVGVYAAYSVPLVQVFIKPTALPWLVLTDPFESQDILRRRTKEFDRSGFIADVFDGILPEHHLPSLTTDNRFKDNRNLISHLMTPAFLTQTIGPRLYNSAITMIKVWQLKCKLAEGRPFVAHYDITYMGLDSLFAAMFGHPESDNITTARLRPISFPSAPIPRIFSAVLTLDHFVGTVQLSPFPRLTSFFLRLFPYMKRATAIKDAYIHDSVDACLALMSAEAPSSDTKSTATDTDPPRTALHSVLLRERSLAIKAGRPPAYHSRAIADEFFGFMLAGHDTAATTLAWGVKFLSDHPAVQARLRRDLRAAMPGVVVGETPSYADMAGLNVPYLDAVVDTTVMGRHVPKGTDVFIMANGAGYLKGNIEVGDERGVPGRERRERSTGALTGVWEDEGIEKFRPERWLKLEEDGKEVFDAAAGPTLPFGMGPRACFGKRFALMQLRFEFALIVWHFDLLALPRELNDYDSVQKFAHEPAQCYVRLGPARD
ncbi:hypothetical protein NEMBOFW57_001147 [Staphylotrichum longicolle]|uniref:Cytochrome P450 monooxygenase n=1 Tax=Staphylotrichum longicolle TaxID=669026 RepID=A0AAD4I1G9_9PEZI|nr:hypothetical protein NEMBOFW57_001147 [Staphylotrichum longicolle]